jgi:hypothetical protein
MKFEKVRLYVSVPRTDRYLVATGSKIRAVKLYKANLKISQAFLPVLAVLEVVLRNKVNTVMSAFYADPDWIISQKTGFMADPSLACSNYFIRKEVEKAERRMRIAGAAITSGKILSEQMFGFWTALFEKYHYKLLAGRPIQIFKSLPAGYGRSEVSKTLNRIRLFRNRLYHNEPVCFSGSTVSFQQATEIHQLIKDVLTWMDPELLDWIKDVDTITNKIKSAEKI